MRIEVVASVVGGVVSGLVVLLGVVLAESLRRRAQRRSRMEKLGYDLLAAMSAEERLLRAGADDDAVTGAHALVMSALYELRTTARSDSAVIAAADECIARTQAAFARHRDGIAFTPAESLGAHLLLQALFPPVTALAARVAGYRAEGLPHDAPRAATGSGRPPLGPAAGPAGSASPAPGSP